MRLTLARISHWIYIYHYIVVKWVRERSIRGGGGTTDTLFKTVHTKGDVDISLDFNNIVLIIRIIRIPKMKKKYVFYLYNLNETKRRNRNNNNKSNGSAAHKERRRSQKHRERKETRCDRATETKRETKVYINCFNFKHKINMRPNKLSEFHVFLCVCVCQRASAIKALITLMVIFISFDRCEYILSRTFQIFLPKKNEIKLTEKKCIKKLVSIPLLLSHSLCSECECAGARAHAYMLFAFT